MNYEINVSLHGKHYFATAPRSLTNLPDAIWMKAHFVKIFPEEEGYKVRLSRITTEIETIDD